MAIKILDENFVCGVLDMVKSKIVIVAHLLVHLDEIPPHINFCQLPKKYCMLIKLLYKSSFINSLCLKHTQDGKQHDKLPLEWV